jgi:hypothetical protein
VRIRSLSEVITAAQERHLSQNTLTAYRRTWLKLIAWSAAEGLALAALPLNRAGELYEETTCGRSASHHLQVKAALALLYDILGSTNPFSGCWLPNSRPNSRTFCGLYTRFLSSCLRDAGNGAKAA